MKIAAISAVVWGLVAATPAIAALPADVEFAKEAVIAISRHNTVRTDNIPEVRAELSPYIDVLATWFQANRPPNEVALTQVPWKNLWYDDPDISGDIELGFGNLTLSQDRTKIYQVVRDGYYYNVSENTLSVGGTALKVQNYLKGAYTLSNLPGEAPADDPRRNVINLVFVSNAIRVGGLPANVSLDRLVVAVDNNQLRAIQIPGPTGVAGELWNLYVDEDLRIAAGYDRSEPDVLDLYILEHVERTSD